jgi:CheY-like chemotaxis protein
MTSNAPQVLPGRKSLSLRAPDGGRPKLLLAEDSDPVRIVTAAMLKGMGCDVEAVVHGEQAVQSASESHFDVIVLDIEMPIMDGITAARSIRRLLGPQRSTPLMALSAFLADSVRSGQWRDTFDLALPKPANRNELHEAVNTALLLQQPDAAATSCLPALIDAEQVKSMQAGLDRAVWQHLSAMAAKDIDNCLAQLERLYASGQHGGTLVFAAKLASLGRTFAAPRLDWAAKRVATAADETARCEALGLLCDTARATLQALRG